MLVAAAALTFAFDGAAQEVGADAGPWSAVARVLRNGKGPCSGVLVAERVVLTVGHCVARREPWRSVPPERLSVRFDEVDHAVTAVHLAKTSPFDGSGRIGPVRHDWALLELAEAPAATPVPYAGGGEVRRAFVLDAPVVKVGWGGGERVRDDTCRIEEVDPQARVFTFTCAEAAGRGRSGSALIVRLSGAHAVIGVQAAEARNNVATIGIAVSPETTLHDGRGTAAGR